MPSKIFVKGARENNLKNIDVEIPRDKLVVVTGLSGIHYLHTGDAALNGLSQIRNGSIFDVLAS